MIQEFKDFVNRGNVVDLAVAVVMAAAFTPIVNAVVDGVLMQIIAAILGEPDFSDLTFDIGDAAIQYGLLVITTIISFLFVALAVFAVVKAYNTLQSEEEGEEESGAGSEEESEEGESESGPSEIDLLTEIRDSLRSS